LGAPGQTQTAVALIRERAAVRVQVALIPVLPLTGVGKIHKPPLRREAAQRAFESAIAPLREEGTAAVTVRDDPTHGLLAAVQVSAPAGASREAIVKRYGELLGGFHIRHAVGPDAVQDRSRSVVSRQRHAIAHSGMPAKRKPSRNLSESLP